VDSTYFDNVTLDGDKVCQVAKSAAADSEWYTHLDKTTKIRYTAEGDNRRRITLTDLTSADLEMLVNPMTGTNKPNVIKIDD
jgi:hypothetical protein